MIVPDSKLDLWGADWTIALSSTQMVRALFPTSSLKLRALNAASWALMPFQPTAVSTANIGIAEVGFASAGAPLRSHRHSHNLLLCVWGSLVDRNRLQHQMTIVN